MKEYLLLKKMVLYVSLNVASALMLLTNNV